MPNYDYLCAACGHEMEVFQSMKDAPLKKCPKCKKLKLARQIGLGAGLIFKGSGFYETDYKRKPESEGKDAKASSGSEAGEKKPGTESKPAAPEKKAAKAE
jgi:putative FmdB family regulatory protein